MSQFDYGIIDPASKSGSQLASDLNNHRSSVHSFHLGASEPSYKVAGMVWIDNSANPIWSMKLYDGSAWIAIISINTVSDASSAYINGILAALGSAASRDIGDGSNDVPINSMLGALAFQSIVGSSNIANAAITSALIANLAVGTQHLAVGAVTNQKLANGSLTLDKFGISTANKSVVTDESGVFTLVDKQNGSGTQLYTTAGAYTFTVPAGVSTLRGWVIGGGGGSNGASLSNSNPIYGGNGGTSSIGPYLSATGGVTSGAGGIGIKGTGVDLGIVWTGGAGSGASNTNRGGMPYFMGQLTGGDQAYYRTSIYYYGNGGVWPGGGAAGTTREGYTTGVGAGAGGTAYGVIPVTSGDLISITVGAGGAAGAGNNMVGKVGAAGMVMLEW